MYSRLASLCRGLGHGNGRCIDRISELKGYKSKICILSYQEWNTGVRSSNNCTPYFWTARRLATGNDPVRKQQGDETSLVTDRLIPAIRRHLEIVSDRHETLVQQSLSPEASTMSNEEISRLNKEIAELSTAVEFKRKFESLRTEVCMNRN